ncbi:MAG TPA: hypothetical protein VGN23_14330 [Verrucomicrobiae bacterium]|jgi:hypothetical protein
MNSNIETVIKRANKEAAAIIKSTAGIRNTFAVGRPNSSQESTVAGTLKSFEFILSRLPKAKSQR